jgi:HK97 family phage portal protein
MRILGLPVPFTGEKKALSPVSNQAGWWPVIREAAPGFWQRNIEVKAENVLSFHAVFACQTLIASDIAKLRIKLVSQTRDRIWQEVDNWSYPVLNKPNHFQTRIQFMESWILSKMRSGNTYVLLQRGKNDRGLERVEAMYVLDPQRVKPLLTETGDVYYELSADQLSGMTQDIVVPARDIIHDRFNCLFHPLVGLSPIFANGLAATHGLAIQNDSTVFFQNGAQPGGILTAPGHISDESAKRLKEHWDTEFSGKNAGKVAVVGDGLKYEALRAKATDSQVIEQLKWTADVVCSTYHVPSYKIGLGNPPSGGNVQAWNLDYYTSCLQSLIEAIEALLDEALGLRAVEGQSPNLGTEFDLDDLLRMDTATQYDVAQKAKGMLTLDEQRRKVNAPPIEGGKTIYLQQQDHSLAAIAARDAQLIEQVNNPPAPEPVVEPDLDDEAKHILFAGYLRKELDAA